ncbi:MAG: dUTP diphosphatase [Sedimentitalea sp.]
MDQANSVRIGVKFEAGADASVPLPSYETAGAAGADVRANLIDQSSVWLQAGARALVPTGLIFDIPQGFEVQVRPRSGLALKHGIMLVNSPGTIDSDYRGPVGLLVLNAGQEDFEITHGMRLAQLVVAPVCTGFFDLVDHVADSERGAHGFGSTGAN